MNVDSAMQIIANVGFPIACCIMLWMQMQKSDELHKEEVEKLRDVISDNTLVIQKLVDRLEEKSHE